MPAYNFKQQFCPYVVDGSKPHTIRNYRTHQVKVGDMLHLYYGMRTKFCQLLRREICTEVKTIAISEKGTVLLLPQPVMPPNEVEALKFTILALDALTIEGKSSYDHDLSIGRPSSALMMCDKDRLAWKDGFRPAGSTLDEPTGAFALMMDFWRSSHDFPFVGNIIYWNPQKLSL